jgi:hypothetical protein
MRMDSIRRAFRNPGTEWRGAPFWSWNDDLDPAEIRWQVRAMKRAGLGGFFMHNRIGLVTPYMGERWMECIGAAVDEASRRGMQAWLYDEDRWPSGFGGGLVVQRNADFALKYLELRPARARGAYRFAVRTENGVVCGHRKLRSGERPRGGETVQVFDIGVAPPSPWFNDLPYADNMNPESVKTFIEICYQPYVKRFAKEFGRTIPGIFTDEPNVHVSNPGQLPPGGWLPWTRRVPEEFRRRRGYDLMRRLPELFSAHPDFFRTRHDFWRTVTELFAEAYCKQLGEWCERHNLELTGHMLCEQEFEQEIPVGGAAMPSLEYMQRPGIDILTEQTHETLTCKQASSVAHQLGRRRTLSETYGTSGWHFTFEAQKWSGDWQTVLGINTRCQHLTPYSLRGMRKRDYPPTFFYHQPWWQYFRVVEDYFARACFFSTIGEPVRQVLLLHNIATAWGDAPDEQTRRRHGEHLRSVAEDLLALHYDFDLGDEIMLPRHGDVEGRRLVVGQASYQLVVVPECETIFGSTAHLLRRFLDAGGKVIAMRRRPTRIEGIPAPALDELFAHENVVQIAAKRDELEDALRACLPRRVSIAAEAGREVGAVIYQERRHQGRSYVMLANRDREAGCRLTVTLAGEGGVEQWDLETGRARSLPARTGGGRTAVEVDMPPTGSLALVLDPKKRASARRRRVPAVVKEVGLAAEWEVRRSTENSLVLDRCRWRFGGGRWSKPMPVLLAQKQLREEMGLSDISHAHIAQPWVRYRTPSKVEPRTVELQFTFAVGKVPADSLNLVVESAELFEIEVNGKPVEGKPVGWWLEKSMDRVPLAHLRRGENELVLRCEYRDAPEYELEECYLIGDFAVDRQTDAIAAEPKAVTAGDWCDQGYPYYAGNLCYGQDVNLRLRRGERAVVKIGPHFGACVAVHVNGRLAGVRGWAPYEVDVTSRVRSGRNRIEVEVCGSPRNLLGPNHQPERRPAWTGPYNFIDWEHWVEKRNLVPYGLFGDVTLRVER